MVAITGNVPTELIGKDSFQEVYIAGVTMPVTKHNFVGGTWRIWPTRCAAAFRIARAGGQGPVLVECPRMSPGALCEYEPKTPGGSQAFHRFSGG